MNTRFDLEYRDASNYHAGETVIVRGEITPAMVEGITQNLEDGMFIIADQVGLPTPSETLRAEHGISEDDHAFTTLEAWQDGVPEVSDLLTDEPPTVDISVAELAEKIATASWDVLAEMKRQGLLDLDPLVFS